MVKAAGLRSAGAIRVGSNPTPRISASNLVVEYQISNLITRVRFPAGALRLGTPFKSPAKPS